MPPSEPTATLDDAAKALEGLQAIANLRAPNKPMLVDHEEADGPDNRISFVRSGGIRVEIDGHRTFLRRPFLGELKSLRLALEQASDEIEDHRQKILETGQALKAERDAILEDTTRDGEDRIAALADVAKRDRAAALSLNETREAALAAWWVKVYTTLGMTPPSEESTPSWFGDASLAGEVLNHWRSTPLARG